MFIIIILFKVQMENLIKISSNFLTRQWRLTESVEFYHLFLLVYLFLWYTWFCWKFSCIHIIVISHNKHNRLRLRFWWFRWRRILPDGLHFTLIGIRQVVHVPHDCLGRHPTQLGHFLRDFVQVCEWRALREAALVAPESGSQGSTAGLGRQRFGGSTSRQADLSLFLIVSAHWAAADKVGQCPHQSVQGVGLLAGEDGAGDAQGVAQGAL